MIGRLLKKHKTKDSGSYDTKLKHIAFIMDGNGRWAQKRGMPRTYGHAVGASVFKKVIEECGRLGIEAVTVYAFSTENWKRSAEEVQAIMKIFSEYLTDAEKSFAERDLQIHFLGRKSVFSPEIAARMEALEKNSAEKRQILNIAVNYGGRDEIVYAVNRLLEEGKTKITEDDITSRLYTKDSPPPDLIVRTGAEQRLSNFLLWEAAYAELYFTDVLWPDFDKKQLELCIKEFYSRKRRFGGV